MKNRGNANHRELTQLEKARLNKGLSISEVCRLINLSYDNYIKYEKEEVKPQYMCLDTLRKISDVLKIDLISDYHNFKANSASVVKKYMEELVKVNEDADFLNFISVEKDNMMIENSIRDEGIRKGLEQGTEQSKNEIAKNMLKENMDISLISKLTGLSNEQINKLK